MTTKADRIRKHYAEGFLTVKEIAALVGCRPEYVRVAARQRADGKASKSDVGFYQRRTSGKDWEAARRKGRAAYQKARSAGADRRSAACAYRTAWSAGLGLRNG